MPSAWQSGTEDFYNKVPNLSGILRSLLCGILFDRIGPSELFVTRSEICLEAG